MLKEMRDLYRLEKLVCGIDDFVSYFDVYNV